MVLKTEKQVDHFMALKKKNNRTLYRLFINFLIKKGDKKSAKRIVDRALLNISCQIKKSINTVLSTIFTHLNSFIEIRRVKIKRRLYFIPFPLRFNRRLYLVLKWLNKILQEDTRKVCFSDKLTKELLNIILDATNAKTIKLKTQNLSQAASNRSNIHFRW